MRCHESLERKQRRAHTSWLGANVCRFWMSASSLRRLAHVGTRRSGGASREGRRRPAQCQLAFGGSSRFAWRADRPSGQRVSLVPAHWRCGTEISHWLSTARAPRQGYAVLSPMRSLKRFYNTGLRLYNTGETAFSTFPPTRSVVTRSATGGSGTRCDIVACHELLCATRAGKGNY